MRVTSGNSKRLAAFFVCILMAILACTTSPLKPATITSLPDSQTASCSTSLPTMVADTPTPGINSDRSPTPSPRPTVVWPPASQLDISSTDADIVTRFGPGEYSAFALSPDGAMLAVAETTGVTLLDAMDFKPRWHVDTPSGDSNVTFSSDGSLLATAEGGTHITVREPTSGAELHTFSLSNYQQYVDLAFSPNNHYLAAKGYLRPTYVWDLRTGKLLYTFAGVTEYSILLAFSPNSRYLVSSQGSYEYASGLLLWDMTSGREVFRFGGLVADALFTPDSEFLLLGYTGSRVDLRAGQGQYQVIGGDPVYGFGGWSLDYQLRVCYSYCGDNGDPRAVIEHATGNVKNRLENPDGLSAFFGLALKFSPDGLWIAGSSGEYYNQSRLFIWDARTGKLQLDLQSDVGNSITWAPDSKTFYAASYYDNAVFAWNPSTGEPLRALQGSGPISAVQWSSDGSTVSGWWTKSNSTQPSIDILLRHDLNTGETLTLYDSPRPPAGFRPGLPLSAQWEGNAITIMNSDTGQTSQLIGHTDQVTTMAWQPDGDLLASGSEDHTVIVWDVRQTKNLLTLLALPGAVRDLAWSPDGKFIAAASGSDVLVWNATSGAMVQHLQQHTQSVNAVAWSPDGSILASASDDMTILLWNITSWQVEGTLKKHTGPVLSLAWSPDGDRLASGSVDGTVIIWQVAQ